MTRAALYAGAEGVRMRLAKPLENGVEWWPIRQ